MLSVAAIGVGLFIAGIPNHRLNSDEAWLGEQAYYRATEGTARSPMFRGTTGVEERVVVQHKLLIETGALAVRLFGWDLWTLRSVAILYSGILFFSFGLYMERRGPAGTGWLAAGVLILTPLYFHWGKIYRPEILVATLSFGCFVMLESAHARNSAIRAFLSGILAGAAACAHYNGITVIAAGTVTWIVIRRFRPGVFFLLGAGLAIFPHLFEIFRFQDLFHRQFFDNPMVSGKAASGWISWFFSLLNEHKRLFRSPEILVMSVPFLLALGAVGKVELRKNRIWYVFWLSVMFFTAIVVKSKLARYALVLHPFFVGEIIRALQRPFKLGMNSRQIVLHSVLLFVIPFCLLASVILDGSNILRSPESPAAASARWAGIIPKKSTVVAPLAFIFDQIDQYDIIALAHIRFNLRGNFADSVQPGEFFAACARFDAEYVILPVGLPEYAPVESSSGESLYGLLHEDTTVVVFHRLRPAGMLETATAGR